jgi:2-methylaconitate cis-trans-isomerase PrpF
LQTVTGQRIAAEYFDVDFLFSPVRDQRDVVADHGLCGKVEKASDGGYLIRLLILEPEKNNR